jgi:hypothetical protein
MKKKPFDTIAFTRQIRDQHHEQLKDATPEERIQFYRDKARQLHEELGLPDIDSGLAAGRRPGI